MRQRPRRACHQCRRLKRRCDGKLPCSACSYYEYTCEYDKAAPRRPAPGPTPLLEASSRASRANEPTIGVLVPMASTETKTGYLEPNKARYLTHDSSVAQARSVGMRLGLPNPPRLHSFGYHTGIRQEPESDITYQLTQNITWGPVRACIDVYTSVIHPIFGFMNMEEIFRKAKRHWEGDSQGFAFEAVISGIIGLASLFSNSLDPSKETEIILHAKSCLEDPVVSRRPCQDLVTAWILRTIYTRATGRPNTAWLHSTTTMHMIEITGLHCDPKSTTLSAESTSPSLRDATDLRQRIILVAQSLHTIIAYDYGKTVLRLAPVVHTNIRPRRGDLTLQLYELTEKIPLTPPETDPVTTQAELVQAMENLMLVTAEHDFLLLAKAELCFALHRRIQLLDLGHHKRQVQLVIAAGTAALPAARRLATLNHPWWGTTSAAFQFLCICLSINTTESLTCLEQIIETLGTVAQRFNTHLTQEALHTARLLIDACLEKKNKEVSILRLAGRTPSQVPTPTEGLEMTMTDEDVASFLQVWAGSPIMDFNSLYDS
ncbi:hypothetical protein BDV23DRAFT_144844 [Aspergillus alliaceus]|uniref:Zn(2)-C6 fungal-type domain-containing protein n=1 Tax=Petromyces alliaceus TaxID=209559 RepID=A0A5N7CNW7_PETAA|nr:hypothetical protein BDV23DRAFT_144844 [Aspergillus alliaceus]